MGEGREAGATNAARPVLQQFGDALQGTKSLGPRLCALAWLLGQLLRGEPCGRPRRQAHLRTWQGGEGETYVLLI